MSGPCKARTTGDQKLCYRCNLAWDINDPDPPQCRTDDELRLERGLVAITNMREVLSDER